MLAKVKAALSELLIIYTFAIYLIHYHILILRNIHWIYQGLVTLCDDAKYSFCDKLADNFNLYQ